MSIDCDLRGQMSQGVDSKYMDDEGGDPQLAILFLFCHFLDSNDYPTLQLATSPPCRHPDSFLTREDLLRADVSFSCLAGASQPPGDFFHCLIISSRLRASLPTRSEKIPCCCFFLVNFPGNVTRDYEEGVKHWRAIAAV